VRVLLSTSGSRGDVEPIAGPAVRLQALGAEVRVCAPPDEQFEERLAGAGVPLVPAGPSVRAMVTGATPRPAADLPRRAAELAAARSGAVAAAAGGCDALVATGMFPAAAAGRETGRPLRVRELPAGHPAVAVPPAAGAAGPAIPTGEVVRDE
jgi:vancomycin aglycone glucosyltransferase